MKDMKHTPIQALAGPNTHIGWTPDGPRNEYYGVNVVLITAEDFDRANRVCNSHEALVKALREAQELYDGVKNLRERESRLIAWRKQSSIAIDAAEGK